MSSRSRSRSTSAFASAVQAGGEALSSARAFLASEGGRRLRHRVASIVIVGAPLLSELPIVRRSPAARLLRTAAVGTLLVRGAEWLRDWEPGPQETAVPAS